MFIRKEYLGGVKSQLENYTLLRSLVEKWIDLAIEVADLKREKRLK